jgi:hypothetical protein
MDITVRSLSLRRTKVYILRHRLDSVLILTGTSKDRRPDGQGQLSTVPAVEQKIYSTVLQSCSLQCNQT